jgi:hypothetical protein
MTELVTMLDHLRRLEELQLMERDRAAFVARRYRDDPVGFARDCIRWPVGGGLAPHQERALAELVERKRVAERGPHGLGKTTTMAVAVLWFACTRDPLELDWKVITTASVWRQLAVYLWPEIKKWARRLRWDVLGRSPFNERTELLDLNLKLKHGAATAVASNQAERIEGAHGDEILYILDEAKIIPPETWDAIEGALSNAGPDTGFNAYIFAMSTPGTPAGRFYDIHRRAPGYEDWYTIHVTLEEAIAAGRISRAWAEQRMKQWGAGSALYQGRVLGNFHADDEDSVIPLAWIEAAQERWHAWDAAGRPVMPGPSWTGVDCARGGDESILAALRGPVIQLRAPVVGRDTMKIVAAAEAEGCRAIVDVVGVGAGVFDRMREKKLRPVAYTGSGKSYLRDRSKEFGFTNVRSAAYWRVRELLDPNFESTLCLPPDDLLVSDLTVPRWEIAVGMPPRIKVETKESVVERLKRSPDRGDAVVMAIYADAVRSPAEFFEPEGHMPITGLSPLA